MFRKLKCIIMAAAIALTAALLIAPHVRSNDSSTELPCGAVSLYREEAHRIELLSYEQLLVGCIFAEVPPSYSNEVLRAAACVLNSRCLSLLDDGIRRNGADISDAECPWMSPDDAAEQHGVSYDSYLKRVTAAAEYGSRHALYYKEKLISPPLCILSTGRTEDGGAPYLATKELPCDAAHPDAISTAAFTSDTVRRTLAQLCGVSRLSARPSEWFGNTVYSDGGRLISVELGGAEITGEQLMDAFSLRSPAITVEYTEERFLFTVRGIGCNKGMSLNAAENMTDSTAVELLSYFYSPAELRTLKF